MQIDLQPAFTKILCNLAVLVLHEYICRYGGTLLNFQYGADWRADGQINALAHGHRAEDHAHRLGERSQTNPNQIITPLRRIT